MSIPPQLLEIRKNFRVERDLLIAFSAILIWDYLATLRLEIRMMWKKDQPWSLLRILFFINRYFSLWVMAFNSWMFLADITLPTCRKTLGLLILNGDVIVLLADSILALRVFAIHERSCKVLVFLVLMLVAEAGVLVSAAVQLHPLVLPPQVSEIVRFHGCVAAAPDAKAQQLAFLFWSPSLIVNLIILSMTLWKSVTSQRRFGSVPIMQRMRRDGIIYFVAVVIVNCVSFGFAAQPEPSLQIVTLPASIVLTSICCSRLVLSLRAHGSEPMVRPTSGLVESIDLVRQRTRFGSR